MEDGVKREKICLYSGTCGCPVTLIINDRRRRTGQEVSLTEEGGPTPVLVKLEVRSLCRGNLF